MSSTSPFTSQVKITHIGTATSIVSVDDVNFLTDPFFSPQGSQWNWEKLVLQNTESPAMRLEHLPRIDAVLLSHEDHPDNLDELGRQLLDGRRVFTTLDGAKNLAPRPAVHGLHPWETIETRINGQRFEITATPAVHYPGQESMGFLLSTESFGVTDGKPNAIYFSGDTVYFEELARIRERYHVKVALLNIGQAWVPDPNGKLIQITMGGKQAAQLFKVLGGDILVPQHFESWKHFTQGGDALRQELEQAGLRERVCWLEPGVSKIVV
ncbi:hypothetical protein NU219Hw_g458t1 [Hortaea werneckii]